MKKKKIIVEKSKREIIKKALSNSENEKMDILTFVLGGTTEPVQPVACNQPPYYTAYADSTYVKGINGGY